MEVKCDNCGRKFDKKLSAIKRCKNSFCSRECYYKFKTGKQNLKAQNKLKVICKECGNEFDKALGKKKQTKNDFCSKECYNIFRSAQTLISCKVCGEDIWRQKSDIKENNFCSQECFGDYRRRNRIDVTCEYCGKQDRVISSRIQGNHYLCSDKCARKFFVNPRTKVLCQNCGEEFEYVKDWFKSERKFCSNKCFGEYRAKHDLAKGKNASNWRGGKSFEEYGIGFNNELKELVRTRDNRTCQECGFHEDELGYTLNCHHLNYDKKDHRMSNLISLCRSCHAQTNFNRTDWQRYYYKKLHKKYKNPAQLVLF